MEADNGVAAVAELARGLFDLVITDNLMPVMSGVELSEWLREEPNGKAPAVILLSGDLSEQERTRAMKSGVSSFLSKPYDREDLLLMVSQAVSSRRPRRPLRSQLH